MPTSINPYRTIHKAQRAHLFALSTELGRTAPDSVLLRPLADRARRIMTDLRQHAEHEDRFVHPLLRTYVPEIAEELEAQHEQLELAFGHLATACEQATSGTAADPGEAAHAFYLSLNQVIGAYLGHLTMEECIAWPALARASSDDEILSRVLGPFFASKPDGFALKDAADQLPHVTPAERAALTAETLAPVPPEQRADAFTALTAQLDQTATDDLRGALSPAAPA